MGRHMTEQETHEYLVQHWELYLAEEMMAAHYRAGKRLVDHVPTLAIQEMVYAMPKVKELIKRPKP